MSIKYLFSFEKCVFGAIPYLQSGYLCFVSEGLELIIFSGYLKFYLYAYVLGVCTCVYVFKCSSMCIFLEARG